MKLFYLLSLSLIIPVAAMDQASSSRDVELNVFLQRMEKRLEEAEIRRVVAKTKIRELETKLKMSELTTQLQFLQQVFEKAPALISSQEKFDEISEIFQDAAKLITFPEPYVNTPNYSFFKKYLAERAITLSLETSPK